MGQPLGHHLQIVRLDFRITPSQNKKRYLLHSESIPTVDVSIETDHSYLLCPVVVAEGPHLVCLLALLLHHWPGVLVTGYVCTGNLNSTVQYPNI